MATLFKRQIMRSAGLKILPYMCVQVPILPQAFELLNKHTDKQKCNWISAYLCLSLHAVKLSNQNIH
jgi:hypothetical protein